MTRSFPDYVNERAYFIILNAAKSLETRPPHGDPRGGGHGGNPGGWGYGGSGGGRYGGYPGQAVDAEP